MLLFSQTFSTPIGLMKAVADEKRLLLFDFLERPHAVSLWRPIFALSQEMIFEKNEVLILLEKQILEYFEGKRKKFEIPFLLFGTEFQQKAWQILAQIPYGQKLTYQQQAEKMSRKDAFRAVAGANSKNILALIVPCHRVCAQKEIGAYSGGVKEKKYLLDLEKYYTHTTK